MDFEHARFNMVEQQIRPWDVLDQDVLDLLFVVRREDFVPPAYRQLAFSDLPIPLNIDGNATGETMLSPKVEARLLQAVPAGAENEVLEIGTGSGYMAALLSRRARRVVSCDVREDLCRFAAANLKFAGIDNVQVLHRHGLQVAADSRFEAIVLSGSVPFIPEALLERLSPGGRLIAIVGDLPIMTAQVITRLGEREFAAENLFDTVAPPLVDFPKKDPFRF